jgi:hypothetical protein
VTSAFPLSIVVAISDADARRRGAQPPGWFVALLREAAAVGAELLVVGDQALAPAGLIADAAAYGVSARFLHASDAELTPELWGRGLLAAQGEVVAFTISQCTVQDGWARALMTGIANGDVGVGGPLQLAADASMAARAIFFLRYSAFLGAPNAERRVVKEIAGDNAAYRRESLMRHGPYGHGFWEVEAHHHLHADGETIAMVPGASASFGGAPEVLRFMQKRFAHGRQYGSWRVRLGGRTRWQMLLSAPLVPFVLLVRTARRASRFPGALGTLMGSAAPFLVIASAWAAGEVAGAFHPTSTAAPREPAIPDA